MQLEGSKNVYQLRVIYEKIFAIFPKIGFHCSMQPELICMFTTFQLEEKKFAPSLFLGNALTNDT